MLHFHLPSHLIDYKTTPSKPRDIYMSIQDQWKSQSPIKFLKQINELV